MVHFDAGYKTTTADAKLMRGVTHLKIFEEALLLEGMSEEETETHLLGVIMVEYYITKKGINLFGNQAKTAVTKELTKINDMNTYRSNDARDLTFQERKDALALLLFITETGHNDQGKIGRRWLETKNI